MTRSNDEGAEREPMLIAHSVLTVAPTDFVDDDQQADFDAAHQQSVEAAARRVADVLDLNLGASDPVNSAAAEATPVIEMGVLSGFDPRNVDSLAMVRRSLEGAASRPGDAMFVASDTAIELNRTGVLDSELDPLRPGSILRRMNEGWQLCVHNPRGLDRPIQDLIDDLAVAYQATTSLFFGMRGALGAMPTPNGHRQLLIQLGGRRSVSIRTADDQQQVQMHPSQVALVPEAWQATHLPLDEDTVHLEVSLSAPSDDVLARSEQAMMPARTSASYYTARSVVESAPDEGWPFRLLAPGGVHVTRVDDETVGLAAGGIELMVSPPGAQILLALADGDYRTGAELASFVSCDPSDAVSFCEALWDLGILDPAPPAKPGRVGGERLTQVASTPTGQPALAQSLFALIDEDAWRAPKEGEVHHGPDVDVVVQPLVGSELQDALATPFVIATQMNAQFFGLDLVGALSEDPPLLIRLRPASRPEALAPSSDADLGSDLRTHPTRKLTFVVALSEVAEGWIHLPGGSAMPAGAAGSLSTWPSLRPWNVGPIVDDEVLLLLSRIHGPAYR